MTSLSIRTALSALIAILIGVIAVVGGLGLWKLHQINDNVLNIGGNWLPSISVTRKLLGEFIDIRRMEGAHSLSSDAADMKDVEAEIAAATATVKKDMDAYAQLVSSPEERENFDKLAAEIQAYA